MRRNAYRRPLAGRRGPRHNPGMAETATARHLAHFEAIRAAEKAEEEARLGRALETPPGERMLRGSKLGAALPWTPALLAEVDASVDGQMELARRRIALGLGRK
ncbi:MAG: hypothetical protein ACREQ9_07275 [Candidatus Binatia bacterium]